MIFSRRRLPATSSRTPRSIVPLGLVTLVVTELAASGLLGCSSTAPPAASGGAAATGGSTSSGGALPGSGGAPASGGAVGSGGVVGSGGIAATGGTVGSGGDAGSGGAVGSGGAGSGGQTGGDCSSLPVCDDFEGVAAGMPPDATIELGWANDVQFASNVLVSATDAHSPSQSVLISGNDTAPWAFQYAAPGATFYARAHMKTGDPGGSGTAVIGIGLNGSHENEIRLRFKDGIVTLNSTASGDGLAPDPAVCTDCLDVPVDTWFCAEMFYDSTTETARIWIDGTLAAEVVNNVGWHSTSGFPATAERIWFGTMAPNGPAPDVFIDDVAVGPNPIGCL